MLINTLKILLSVKTTIVINRELKRQGHDIGMGLKWCGSMGLD
jgi:hypothetical protein